MSLATEEQKREQDIRKRPERLRQMCHPALASHPAL